MNEEHDGRGELVPIGGLWIHEDRDGKTFLSGYLGEARLLVFKNKFKKPGEKQPDYRMYVSRKPKPDQADPLANTETDPLASGASDGDVAAVANGGTDKPPF